MAAACEEATEMGTEEFDYRPSRLRMVALFVLAAAGNVLIVYFAFLLEGPIRWFFAFFAVLAPIGLIALASAVFIAFKSEHSIVLTNRSIRLQEAKGFRFFTTELVVPLDEIVEVTSRPSHGPAHSLSIVHSTGRVVVSSVLFRKPGQLDALIQALTNALASRSGRD